MLKVQFHRICTPPHTLLLHWVLRAEVTLWWLLPPLPLQQWINQVLSQLKGIKKDLRCGRYNSRYKEIQKFEDWKRNVSTISRTVAFSQKVVEGGGVHPSLPVCAITHSYPIYPIYPIYPSYPWLYNYIVINETLCFETLWFSERGRGGGPPLSPCLCNYT